MRSVGHAARRARRPAGDRGGARLLRPAGRAAARPGRGDGPAARRVPVGRASRRTSRSAPYLLEEAYEVLETIEEGDYAALREELGDLLLQVVFHARVARTAPTGSTWTTWPRGSSTSWSGAIRTCSPTPGWTAPSEVSDNWETIKAAERAAEGRRPVGRSTACRWASPRSRWPPSCCAGPSARAPPTALAAGRLAGGRGASCSTSCGARSAAGLDPEAELRAAARAYRDRVRSGSDDPGTASAGPTDR